MKLSFSRDLTRFSPACAFSGALRLGLLITGKEVLLLDDDSIEEFRNGETLRIMELPLGVFRGARGLTPNESDHQGRARLSPRLLQSDQRVI